MPKYYVKSGNLDFCCVAGGPEEAIAIAVGHYRDIGKDVGLASVIGVNEHGWLELDRVTKDDVMFPTRQTIARMFGDELDNGE